MTQNGFVNWDDPDNFLDNLNYRGLHWANLRWMFTTFHMTLYRPLTWVTHGIDYLLWGMEPGGYHITSLIIHGANALLFYRVSWRILARVFRQAELQDSALASSAGFAALLFAVHPLRVEAVAWASGRENVVAGFFSLLTVICYLKAVDRPNITRSEYWPWITLTWLSFGLSLLSKVSVITLPLVLLVMDVYPLKRLSGGLRSWFRPPYLWVWCEKIPLVIVSAIISVVGVLAKDRFGTVATLADYGVMERVNQMMYGLFFYLWKTIVPTGLSPLYEKHSYFNSIGAVDFRSALVVVTLTATFVIARKLWPVALACWSAYGLMLVPVLGVIPFGPQVVADRYSYLSNMTWALLGGAALLHCARLRLSGRIKPQFSFLVNSIAGSILVFCSLLTWQQSQVWHDSDRLWHHALAVDPNSSFAYNNLGLLLADRGETQEAVKYFRSAMGFDPNFAEAHNNLGNVLVAQGLLDQGVEAFRKAIALKPAFAEAHSNLANALAQRGEFDAAQRHLQQALEVNPNSADAHYNLARLFASQGNWGTAIAHYEQALVLNPTAPDIHNNLGLVFMRQGNLDRAVGRFYEALKANPKYVNAHFNLGRARLQQGRADDAVRHFEEALRLRPDVAEIHEGLARALALKGSQEKAPQHAEAAQQILKTAPQAAPHH